MAIKKIIQNPNPILHTKTETITDFKDKSLHKLIKDMKDTLRDEDGLGLAAPQIGTSKAVFIIPSNYAPRVRSLNIPLSIFKPIEPTVYINPRITFYSKEKSEIEEGCLSMYGIYYSITRPEKITIEAQTENGKNFSVRTEGLLAKIFQHETDHLNGLLIIDKLHEK